MTPTDRDMERARAYLTDLRGGVMDERWVKDLAPLIAQVREETLEEAANIAEQTVVQKPLCSTREQHRKRGKVMTSLTRQAIAQEIRSLKTKKETTE